MPTAPRRHPTWFAFIAASALLLAGCGGGGGSADVTPPRALTPGEAQAAAQGILDGCVSSSTDEALAVLALLQPLLEAQGETDPTLPPFTLGGVNVVNGALTATWTADLDSDTIFESSGTASLRGLTLLQLAALASALNGSNANAPELLAALPDGAVLALTFTIDRIFQSTGTVDVAVSNDGSGAVPSTSTGSLRTAQPDCAVTYGWSDVALADILVADSAYPNADVTLDVVSTQGDMNGIIAFDGTSTALIDAIVDPGQVHSLFTLDLTTGTVTPATP